MQRMPESAARECQAARTWSELERLEGHQAWCYPNTSHAQNQVCQLLLVETPLELSCSRQAFEADMSKKAQSLHPPAQFGGPQLWSPKGPQYGNKASTFHAKEIRLLKKRMKGILERFSSQETSLRRVLPSCAWNTTQPWVAKLREIAFTSKGSGSKTCILQARGSLKFNVL